MAKNPTARETREKSIDRSAQIKRDDKVSIPEVGLYDIDLAVKFYIDNVIQPNILNGNGSIMQLPVIYGSSERWKSVQKTNFYRDARGKIQLPLFMYRKTDIVKNRELGNKVDPNAPVFQSIKMKYTKKNQYDNFSRLYGRKKIEEYHNVVVPDYVRVSYECIIWTDLIAQMNSVVEAINYAEGAYWGDPNKFSFKSKIDSFSPATEISKGTDRATKCSFNLQLDGFIIPQTIQKQVNSQMTKTYSTSQIVFGSEVTSNIDDALSGNY
tara:strand:+ start:223 stop:1026 length:804 start_codon:yes stop_codon:yes gene_type:complete